MLTTTDFMIYFLLYYFFIKIKRSLEIFPGLGMVQFSTLIFLKNKHSKSGRNIMCYFNTIAFLK